MDSHPSCRRPHKLPAHTFKEPRTRPQRLLPCPDVSVEVSRSFWPPVFVSSTPREEEVSEFPHFVDEAASVRGAAHSGSSFRFRQHLVKRPFPEPLTRAPMRSR